MTCQNNPPRPVHIWFAAIGELNIAFVRTMRWVLSDWEQRRLDSLQAEADKVRFVAAHLLVRVALSKLYPAAMTDWRLDHTLDGKPFVRGPYGTEGFQFSLSHAGELVGCAIASVPVGFDIEPLHQDLDVDELLRPTLAPQEISQWDRQSGEDRVRRYLSYWTLKEALAKGLGVGMNVPFSSLAFDLKDNGQARVLTMPASLGDALAWKVHRLDLMGTHVGAVAVRPEAGEAIELRINRFEFGSLEYDVFSEPQCSRSGGGAIFRRRPGREEPLEHLGQEAAPAMGSSSRNATEEALAAIWCGLFHRDHIDIHDDFFELGGHSLLAMRVLARVRSSFGVDLDVRDFFAAPTIVHMAGLIAQRQTSPAAVPALERQRRGDSAPAVSEVVEHDPAHLRQSVHELFEKQARERPDALALVHKDRRISYRELNRLANAVARELLQWSLAADSIVALCVDRSPETIAAMLGIPSGRRRSLFAIGSCAPHPASGDAARGLRSPRPGYSVWAAGALPRVEWTHVACR